MRKTTALAALALMLLGGCVASKVDGNRVNYPNGLAFEISDAYAPAGKAPYQKQVTATNSRQAIASSVIHVFVKKDTPYKDKTEFVGVYDFMLPQRWFNLQQGLVPARSFRMDMKKYPEVAELLKDRGFLVSSRFLCGEFHFYAFDRGEQSLLYCAAESVVPAGVDDLTFVRGRFAEGVRQVGGETPPAQPSPKASPQPVPQPAPQAGPAAAAQAAREAGTQVLDAGGRGKYVVIAYSKVGDTARIGRSYKSAEEALNSAVAGCEYSDCRKIWVSNMDGCVALATQGRGEHWGKARGADAKEAKAGALKFCNAYSKDDGCQVVTSACPEY